jgi:colanic acid/amylovoran biosynthesis glycosyltransferase
MPPTTRPRLYSVASYREVRDAIMSHTRSARVTGGRILVSKVGPVGYSETFILSHARHLPGDVKLHDGTPPVDSRWYEGAMRRAGWQGVSRRARRYWERVLTDLTPDVVLAEHGQTAVSMMEACWRRRVPLVAHFHGSDAWVTTTASGHRHSYRRLFDRVAAVVVASDSMADRLRALGAPEHRLHLVRIGVDIDEIRPASPEDAPPHFIGAGRFVGFKGHDYTIRAFARVASAQPEARLTIFGDGPLLDQCRALVRDLSLEEWVELPGARRHEDVIASFRTARAFVHHGITTDIGSREGGPLVVAEAQAAGLPVVATRSGGAPEMITHGATGLLVTERDEVAMAEAMLSVARQPEMAARLGRAARRRVEDHQSLRASTDALAAVLRAAADGHR